MGLLCRFGTRNDTVRQGTLLHFVCPFINEYLGHRPNASGRRPGVSGRCLFL